jgi:hypothetical protein
MAPPDGARRFPDLSGGPPRHSFCRHKRGHVDRNRIVVWRLHDGMHAGRPDGIAHTEGGRAAGGRATDRHRGGRTRGVPALAEAREPDRR